MSPVLEDLRWGFANTICFIGSVFFIMYFFQIRCVQCTTAAPWCFEPQGYYPSKD